MSTVLIVSIIIFAASLLIIIVLIDITRNRLKYLRLNPPPPPEPVIFDISEFKGIVSISNAFNLKPTISDDYYNESEENFRKELSLAKSEDYLTYNWYNLIVWRQDPEHSSIYHNTSFMLPYLEQGKHYRERETRYENKCIIKDCHPLNLTFGDILIANNAIFISFMVAIACGGSSLISIIASFCS